MVYIMDPMESFQCGIMWVLQGQDLDTRRIIYHVQWVINLDRNYGQNREVGRDYHEDPQ